MTSWGGDHDDYVELVLRTVEAIPPGRATTYGELAAAVRDITGTGGPRQVGNVMAQYGAAVAWWRVVRADGGLHRDREDVAMQEHRAEGTPMRDPRRVDLARARWRPVAVPGIDR